MADMVIRVSYIHLLFEQTYVANRYFTLAWPVVFTWYVWAKAYNTSEQRPARLVAGTFPTAIARDDKGWVGLKYINPAAFTSTTHDAFQKFFSGMAKDLSLKLNNHHKLQLIDPENVVKNLTSVKKRKAFIADQFAIMWNDLCFPDNTYHQSSCGAYKVSGRHGRGGAWESLLFVRIQSQDNDDDGLLDYMTVDGEILTDLLAPTVNKADSTTGLPVMATPTTSMVATMSMTGSPRKKFKSSEASGIREDGGMGREIDFDILPHVRLLSDAIYIPDQTNPNEIVEEPDDEESVGTAVTDSSYKGFEEKHDDSESEIESLASSLTGRSSGDWEVIHSVSPVEADWCVYTSNITEEKIRSKGINNFERLTFGEMDDFVSDLHCGLIWLDEKPVEEGDSSLLREKDEWRCWFKDTLNAGELSAVKASTSTIGGFTMKVSLAPLSRGPSDTFPYLQFTTESTITENTFGSTQHILPSGLLKDRSVLVFGLAPSQSSQDVSLGTLFDFVGLESLQENPLIRLLTTPTFKIPSTLEDLRMKRNAIWFIPSYDYNTTVRLEWELSSETHKQLNEILRPVHLEVGKTTVIARRSSSWSTNGDETQIISNGNIVFRTAIAIGKINLDATFELTKKTTTLTLTVNTRTKDILSSVLEWISGVIGVPATSFDFVSLQNKSFGSSSLGEFDFRRITIELVKDSETKKISVGNFKLDMEVSINHQTGPTLFMLSYVYQQGDGSSVKAILWCRKCSSEFFSLLTKRD